METITRADFLEKFPQFQDLADIVDAQADRIEVYNKCILGMLAFREDYSAYQTAIEAGREEERFKTAQAMKAKGYPLADIAEITSLTIEEIAQL